MKNKGQLDRRSFVKTSAAAGAAAGMVPYVPWSKSAFANRMKNDRPVIGCIGVGSMGSGDARGHNQFGRDIVAVCDVDAQRAEAARTDENIGKGKADAYGDYRKVLERDDIEVVSIVTPDHWHVEDCTGGFGRRQACVLSETVDADA
ncbi:MAG: Gfo/Idh/MocA family oxidoreductase [Pirellulaceae bacterium]